MSAMMGRHSAVEPVQVVRRTSMTARSSASVGESMPAQQRQHMNPSVKFTNPQSTNNIPQRAGKYSTFHKQERQTQPHPYIRWPRAKWKSEGWACDTYSRSSPGRRGVHRSRRLGYRPPCPEPACLRRTDRWPRAGCIVRRRLPWRRRALLAATVCVRRQRGDRPLRNSPSVTSALQAVAMPTMSSCASAMIGES